MKFFLLLSLIGFCWAQYDPHTQYGRTAIVHLFEWRWVDIAKECERYLAPNGFAGVQVSPPNENIVVHSPSRPWWERYQPISYKICSRSGNEDEFRDMVNRCNNVGVRIYVDAVINHMCGVGAQAGQSSTCGSYFNHDNQRGHGAGGASILTFWDARLYKMAVGFMLAHPYGFTRVMSSYYWPRNFQNGKDVNDWVGPPNNNGKTKEVSINPDSTCGNDWICEHRWRQIRNLVCSQWQE